MCDYGTVSTAMDSASMLSSSEPAYASNNFTSYAASSTTSTSSSSSSSTTTDTNYIVTGTDADPTIVGESAWYSFGNNQCHSNQNQCSNVSELSIWKKKKRDNHVYNMYSRLSNNTDCTMYCPTLTLTLTLHLM